MLTKETRLSVSWRSVLNVFNGSFAVLVATSYYVYYNTAQRLFSGGRKKRLAFFQPVKKRKEDDNKYRFFSTLPLFPILDLQFLVVVVGGGGGMCGSVINDASFSLTHTVIPSIWPHEKDREVLFVVFSNCQESTNNASHSGNLCSLRQ